MSEKIHQSAIWALSTCFSRRDKSQRKPHQTVSQWSRNSAKSFILNMNSCFRCLDLFIYILGTISSFYWNKKKKQSIDFQIVVRVLERNKHGSGVLEVHMCRHSCSSRPLDLPYPSWCPVSARCFCTCVSLSLSAVVTVPETPFTLASVFYLTSIL